MPADDAAIRHALGRLTFGPRPGDVDEVRRVGLAAWIERQLEPARIPDKTVEARLAGFTTLTLDSGTIAREYYQPARQARREQKRAETSDMAAPDQPEAGTGDRRPQLQLRQVPPAVREGRRVLDELQSARLLRAVYSERQLEEVLVDFWFNHFNVFAGKGRTSIYITEYEREAIRPHALGRFRDLLGATAKSPAMLFYLDNWMNGRRGLNENYARELLELHTLGVDGGYTQKDVVEVARAFTGWTIGGPRGGDMQSRRRGGVEEHAFHFARAIHDDGAKVVLGQAIAAGGGMGDGERVLDLVAAHPSTARHIAGKLAQRVVSDTPPDALVARAAARFRETKGDLREVVRTIVTSPELFAPEARRAKIKTPLEFVASAMRATRAEVDDTRPALRALQQLGMPLYLCQPPTGYDDTAETWVSPGALVNRMNVAVALANPRARGASTPLSAITDLATLRARLIADALGGEISDATRSTVDKATTAQQAIALVIGSPEFQRR